MPMHFRTLVAGGAILLVSSFGTASGWASTQPPGADNDGSGGNASRPAQDPDAEPPVATQGAAAIPDSGTAVDAAVAAQPDEAGQAGATSDTGAEATPPLDNDDTGGNGRPDKDPDKPG